MANMQLSLVLFLSTLFVSLSHAQSDDDGGVDNEGGASGSDGGGYSLSQGGIIAICVVVGVVVIIGIASTVLFVEAKRRNWNIRQSIARASRRLTGRSAISTKERQSKRRGTVRLRENESNTDIEKGPTKKITHTMEVESPGEKRWKAILPESWSVGGARNGQSSNS